MPCFVKRVNEGFFVCRTGKNIRLSICTRHVLAYRLVYVILYELEAIEEHSTFNFSKRREGKMFFAAFISRWNSCNEHESREGTVYYREKSRT